MPNFLAMSFEGELAPSFDLRCLHPGKKLPDGWGIGYYPGGEPSASVLKEPAPPQGSIRSELVKAWEHLESSLFLIHIRTATWGSISDANTQPFTRSWGRRDWMMAHSGSLKHRLELGETSQFEPVGSTDTEIIFCELLSRLAKRGWKSLGDIEPATLRLWFDVINEHGSLTSVLTDGRDLAVYADRNDEGAVYVWELLPPYQQAAFGDDELEVDLTSRGIKSRKGVLVCSAALASTGQPQGQSQGPSPGQSQGQSQSQPQGQSQGQPQGQPPPGRWRKLAAGTLLIVRQGAIRAEIAADAPVTVGASSSPVVVARASLARPTAAEVKRYAVNHRTVYRYEKPVERSTHLFRVVPVHDRLQTLLEHSLTLSINGAQVRDYEDVFGNRARRVVVDTPFSELVIEARSKVELLDVDPLSFRPLRARSTIPLVWMPWQRQALEQFLLPPELAESELLELVEYAMSFVERNDYDLLDTLLDINSSIFKEYEYKQGSTSLSTTAFDVYANRRGVCQDFTNLFICMARLLGVPARYVCGYIYTGPKHENQRQGEASHAWVQVYLPEVGWKGFDPTNGVLTQTEHIRVATGRNYIDATPTSGTIYVGGGGETLEVDVRVELI